MKVLLSGGGTAGHINPALSIAKKIQSVYPDAQIAFVGTPTGMENKLVAKEGYPIYHVDVKGFIRKLTPKNIPIAYKALTSPIKAKKIIREFAPDIVIGTGGYVSWPTLKAAAKMKIPTAVHEQNAVPGVTTKMLSKLVDKVMISFEESRKYFDCPEKLVLVGNPVNPKMLSITKKPHSTPVLLSYGGSLGARRINDVMLDFAKENPLRGKMRHYHAVGSVEWQKRQPQVEALKEYSDTEITEYIYDMPEKMVQADLVVCRAGAITLAELAVLGKPAILIPSPNVTNNHQYKNAKVIENAGAAVLIEEKDLTSELIRKKTVELLCDRARLENMAKCAEKLAIRDTADKIMQVIGELLK